MYLSLSVCLSVCLSLSLWSCLFFLAPPAPPATPRQTHPDQAIAGADRWLARLAVSRPNAGEQVSFDWGLAAVCASLLKDNARARKAPTVRPCRSLPPRCDRDPLARSCTPANTCTPQMLATTGAAKRARTKAPGARSPKPTARESECPQKPTHMLGCCLGLPIAAAEGHP